MQQSISFAVINRCFLSFSDSYLLVIVEGLENFWDIMYRPC